ncbi:piggyBac transposable element-derived protein 4 [Trichonephila clavipes]|nr:piggyBac transposable element-derived protein 4 [Trichonephila clavipes]
MVLKKSMPRPHNDVMIGVDCFDQRRERYQIRRGSVKWWFRIFYFLIDLAITNSFIVWQVNKIRRPSNIPYSISPSAHRRIFLKKRKGRPPCSQVKKYVVPDDVRLASVRNHMSNRVSNHILCRKCVRD